MIRNLCVRHGTILAKACYITALLNSLFLPARGQEAQAETSNTDTDPPLRYGPFDVLYSLQGGVLYDDNIYLRADKESDVIWTISPKVTVGAGDYRIREENLLTLDYSPTLFFFTDQSGNNAVDHAALLYGQWRPGAWKFGLQQGYQNFSGALVDVGDRVDRQIYSTALEATYELSPRTSFELDGYQTISDFERLISYNEWLVRGWMDYEVTPLVKAGAGLSGGFVDVQQGANQTYQQALARIRYTLTELVTLSASAGGELRQFQGSQDDRFNPVFSLGATYKPLENTTFSLEAYRRSQASIVLRNQNYTTTGFKANVRQVMFDNYAVHLTGGYENSDYTANQSAIAAPREDNYYHIQLGADWRIIDRGTVSAFYQFRNNDSTDPDHDFDNHQIGLSFTYRF